MKAFQHAPASPPLARTAAAPKAERPERANLQGGPGSKEVVIVGRSQNLVSHHLRALRSRGLVRSRKDGKMVMYSLTEAGASLLSAVLGGRAEVGA